MGTKIARNGMLLAKPETSDKLQITDEKGAPLGSVVLPTDPRLFGPSRGTVYLQRTPPKGPARAA